MNAKKLAAVLLTGTLAMGLLAGCGSDTENNQGSTEETAQNAEETPDDTSETEESDNTKTQTPENGKTLVVYYSATGNTKDVANTISELTNADILELEPVKSYSDEDLDWTDENSRVYREHENEDERVTELTAETVEDWNSYQNVLIGYPKMQYGI